MLKNVHFSRIETGKLRKIHELLFFLIPVNKIKLKFFSNKKGFQKMFTFLQIFPEN